MLQISAAHPKQEALEVLAKEIAPAATSLAPGLAQLIGGRAHPTPRVKLITFLFPKARLTKNFSKPGTPSGKVVSEAGFVPTFPPKSAKSPKGSVSLSAIAYARSGDKGNDVNIGLIARSQEDFAVLKKEMTAERVTKIFSREFDAPKSPVVSRWELPGIYALNFLLKDCLGGGGAYSLKSDPQGKAFGQRLLETRISL